MNLSAFKKRDFCLLAAILVLTLWGFTLRIYALGHQSLWNDEAASINAALGMLEHGWPLLPSGAVYSRSILNTGVIASSIGLFGSSEFAARLPSVLFGTLTIPLVFLFARKIGNDKIALIAAIITAFSVLEVAWSRQARMYQQLQFFYLLSLYLFYQFSQTKSKRYLIATIVSTLCAGLSHEFGFVLVLIFPIYAFLLNIRNVKKFLSKEFLLQKKVIVSILAIIALLTLAEVEFGVFSSVLSSTGHVHLHYYLGYLLTTIPVVSLLAVVGAVLLFRRERRTSLLLILSIIIPLYFLSFHLELWGYRYFYFLLPVVFILFSCGVVYSIDLIPELRTRRRLSLLLPALLLVLTLSYGFVYTPHSSYYHFDSCIQQPDFKRAYSFVEENRNEGDIVIDAWPVVGMFYLSKTPDYWLQWDTSGRHVKVVENGEPREAQSDAPVIENLDMLEDVIEESERGWIVIDTFAWNLLPAKSKGFIEEELTYYEEGSSTGEQGDIMVYGW
jgi:4-amino-4-deoxy-L-arabinose transferase-like glycosyltransferase